MSDMPDEQLAEKLRAIGEGSAATAAEVTVDFGDRSQVEEVNEAHGELKMRLGGIAQ